MRVFLFALAPISAYLPIIIVHNYGITSSADSRLCIYATTRILLVHYEITKLYNFIILRPRGSHALPPEPSEARGPRLYKISHTISLRLIAGNRRHTVTKCYTAISGMKGPLLVCLPLDNHVIPAKLVPKLATSPTMAYSPKRLRPAHLEMVTLHLAGDSNADIATKMGYTAQQVSNILNCQAVLEILAALRDETINTMSQVQAEAQLYAPEILRRKIDYALKGDDARVRNTAQTEILHLAGHVPIRRVSIEEKSSVVEKYKDKSEDELRAMVRGDTSTGVNGASDKGPDGRLLQ